MTKAAKMAKTRKSGPVAGTRYKLTRTEEKILRVLTEKHGAPMSREEMAETLWPDKYFNMNLSNLDKHICNMRPKLGKGLELRSFYGRGYAIITKHPAGK